jgi:IclR family acetate operon transcriptional repressor
MEAPSVKRDYSIAAVNKVLNILEFLGQQRRAVGLPELSRALGIPKPTMFRYVVTLQERGYVQKSYDGEAYTLGLKILELSTRTLGQATLHEIALPHMRTLLDQFRETVNLGVLEGNQVVYVEILESPQPLKMSSQVGGRDYAHSTALGKSILAYRSAQEVDALTHVTGLPKFTHNTPGSLPELKDGLAQVREQGYAVDDEQNEEGTRCVGAPIFDHEGVAIAAVSISGPSVRIDNAMMEEMGAAVLGVTRQISKKLGHLAR